MKSKQLLTTESVSGYLGSREFLSRHDDIQENTAAKILRYGSPVGCRIELHDRIPRCMELIQEMITRAEEDGTSLPSGTVIISRQLENGSGRFARSWHAPEGGFWMAMAWADTLLPDYARLLPLAAGTACCEAIRNYGIESKIKWVNDIHVQDRKIGGILCETSVSRSSGDRYHLIGIGINCNVEKFPEELRDSAVSMHEVLRSRIDLESFGVELLASLAWNFGLVHLQEELSLKQDNGDGNTAVTPLVIHAWQKLSDSIGRKVIYGYDVVRNPLYRATVMDIDALGGLVLQLEDGSAITEYSGEILYLD